MAIAYKISLYLILLCFSLNALGDYESNDIVLVTPVNSDLHIDDESFLILSSLEIRKVFLGLPVTRNGNLIEGLVFQPDEEMREIFLRAMVGMTTRTYDKKVLQVRLSSGGSLVPIYTELSELLADFDRSPNAISFVTYEEAKEHKLQVVQVLWRSRN